MPTTSASSRSRARGRRAGVLPPSRKGWSSTPTPHGCGSAAKTRPGVARLRRRPVDGACGGPGAGSRRTRAHREVSGRPRLLRPRRCTDSHAPGTTLPPDAPDGYAATVATDEDRQRPVRARLQQVHAVLQVRRGLRRRRAEHLRDRGRRTWLRRAHLTEYAVPLPDSACVYCGNCIGVCPTGALMPKREFDMRAAGRGTSRADRHGHHLPVLRRRLHPHLHVQDNEIVKASSPPTTTSPTATCASRGASGGSG